MWSDVDRTTTRKTFNEFYCYLMINVTAFQSCICYRLPQAIREVASPIRDGATRIAHEVGGKISHAAHEVGDRLSAIASPPRRHPGGIHPHEGGDASHGHSHGEHSHAHSHSHSHGHGHSSVTGEGDAHVNMAAFSAQTEAGRQRILSKLDDPQREAWMRPDQVVGEVLLPLIRQAAEAKARAPSSSANTASASGSSAAPTIKLGRDPAVVVADVGAGAGFFAKRIAKVAASAASASSVPTVVIATEPQAWMREVMLLRAVEDGVKNLLMVAGSADKAGIASAPAADAVSTGLVDVPSSSSSGSSATPLGVRADVIFLCNVYHHIGLSHGHGHGSGNGEGGGHGHSHGHSHGGGSDDGSVVSREAWLRDTVEQDLAPGACEWALERMPPLLTQLDIKTSQT